MTTKEVLQCYHEKVPFPITSKKIRAAGYDPADYLIKLGEELAVCEDSDGPLVQQIIENIRRN